MSDLNYITITYNSTSYSIRKPQSFKPQREDVYSGEYTTCTGKTVADRIGWKYSDLTLEWDALPQESVDALVNIPSDCTITFDDFDGDHTEKIIRSSVVGLRNRATIDGVYWWSGVSLEVRFVNVND